MKLNDGIYPAICTDCGKEFKIYTRAKEKEKADESKSKVKIKKFDPTFCPGCGALIGNLEFDKLGYKIKAIVEEEHERKFRENHPESFKEI